ncbi:MAG: bile acid:sodium symporter family protein [Bacteroidia bacterium]
MDSTSTIILAIALFIIMIGMGLSLTLADFRRVLKMPKAVLIGLLNQIILLPLIGYGLSIGFGVEPAIAIGVMILAACPGGPTSNLVTHLAKGDIALSVTLTAVNSLITIISIPLIISFALDAFLGETAAIEAPIGNIIGSLVVIIAIPLAIGMLVKRYAEAFADKMERSVRIASGVLITLVIVGLVIKERAHIVEYFQSALMITLALNIATMLVGYLTAKVARLSFRQALTIAIESGNQNGTLAISLAVVSLARPDFAIAAAVYSIMMYVTASVAVYIGNRAEKEAFGEAAA